MLFAQGRALGRRIRVIAATAGAVGALSAVALTGAAPAAAAEKAADRPAVALDGGTAPACILRTVNKKTDDAVVTNRCGKTMRVKIIVNNGYDSSCHTLRNGKGFYYTWPWGSYARTVTC
ncbi:hypothetical protein [Streptomyces axinellae]|uniref:Uncharacterized protein n=1 Tax=Streptomyces axinellae TaxID=552788 RepID=A0ABN3QIA1_9ACTN